MSEQNPNQAPDVMQLWRDWLTQTERQFNSLTSEAMGSEAFARSMASFMETFATVQRLMAEAMQRYLQFMNMPSRSDVVALGETLRSIEERLVRIEETLEIAAEQVDANGAAPRAEPPRTRQPAGFGDGGVATGTVPEELRR